MHFSPALDRPDSTGTHLAVTTGRLEIPWSLGQLVARQVWYTPPLGSITGPIGPREQPSNADWGPEIHLANLSPVQNQHTKTGTDKGRPPVDHRDLIGRSDGRPDPTTLRLNSIELAGACENLVAEFRRRR